MDLSSDVEPMDMSMAYADSAIMPLTSAPEAVTPPSAPRPRLRRASSQQAGAAEPSGSVDGNGDSSSSASEHSDCHIRQPKT